MTAIYRHEVHVTEDLVDRNGHVNNVAYVQWMQDAAVQHARASGCTQVSVSLGATWVVRTHRVEYFRPAFAGDRITVLTWVADWRKVRSLRKYKMVRGDEPAPLVRAETDWVFVDVKTGRPRPIPAEIKNTLPAVENPKEP